MTPRGALGPGPAGLSWCRLSEAWRGLFHVSTQRSGREATSGVRSGVWAGPPAGSQAVAGTAVSGRLTARLSPPCVFQRSITLNPTATSEIPAGKRPFLSLRSRRSCSGRQAGGARCRPQRAAGCEPGCRSSRPQTLQETLIPDASLSFGAQRRHSGSVPWHRAPPAGGGLGAPGVSPRVFPFFSERI